MTELTTTPHTEGRDVTDETEAALWASIEAAPEDGLRRLVLADYLEDNPTVACGWCGGAGKRWWECKVCGARPDDEGEVSHGRGCYTLSEDGGGSEWVDSEPCPACSGTGRVSDGRAEMAAALRATAAKYPDKVPDPLPFVWWVPPGVGVDANIIDSDDVFDLLYPAVDTSDSYGTPGQVDSHKHYHTAADAIRDLCRAWIAVHTKSEVPA